MKVLDLFHNAQAHERILLTLLLMVLSSFLNTSLTQASENTSADYIHALTLIAQGQKKESYKLLESVYHDSKDPEERGRAALILSFVDNKNLEIKKRHHYAEYVIHHPQFIPTKKDRFILLRIMGDGFFEEAQLNKAAASYEMLSKSENSEETDYAQYKLAWIDLNYHHPLLAFNRFYLRVWNGKNRTQSQSLRKSLIRDLGRSWAETQPPQDSQLQSILKLDFNTNEASGFADGIITGLKRINTFESIALFRDKLLKTKYGTFILSRVLSQGIGLIQDDPCSVLDWFVGPTSYQGIKPALILPRLNSCYRWVLKKDPTGINYDVTLQNLVLAYEELPLNGLTRWTLADLYKKIKQPLAACNQFVSMSQEMASLKKETMPPEVITDLGYTCGLAIQDSQNTLDQNTKLLEKIEPILKVYAPQPIVSEEKETLVWIELLRSVVAYQLKNQKYSEAENLLKTFVPLEKTSFKYARLTELWLLWAVSAPIEITTPVNKLEPITVSTAEQATTLYFETITEKTSSEQTTRALALALKFNQIKSAWKVWEKLNITSPQNAPLVSNFYQRTFQWLIENKIKTKDIEDSSQGNTIAKVYKIIKYQKTNKSLEDTLNHISSFSLDLPKALRPGFLNDAQTIHKINQASHKVREGNLAFTSSLPQKMTIKIETIRKQMKTLKTHTWSHQALAKLASQIIAQTCETLSMQLEKIKHQKSLDKVHTKLWLKQLQPIINTVSGWKKTLLISQANLSEEVL